MATLYEIGADLDALYELIEETMTDGGEVSDIIDAWLTKNEQDLKTKIDNYAALILEKTAQAKARREESQRLAHSAKVAENLVERLKDRLVWFYDLHGYDKVEANRFNVGTRISTAVEFDCAPEELPEEYQRKKTTVSGDKKTIGADLKAGKEIPHCRLVEKKNISIR